MPRSFMRPQKAILQLGGASLAGRVAHAGRPIRIEAVPEWLQVERCLGAVHSTDPKNALCRATISLTFVVVCVQRVFTRTGELGV